MSFDYLFGLYAVSVVTGGVIGYVKAGSTSSLAAGLTFGSLLAFGTYQMSMNPKNIFLSLATTSLLAIMMGYRFYNSGKFMPAGLIASMSGFMVLRFAYKISTTHS